MHNIEFVDRYGSAGPPAWIRGCHNRCEATGWIPVFVMPEGGPGPLEGQAYPICEATGRERERWGIAHEGSHHDGEPCDGWHFVRCPECNGTGLVNWLVSVKRIPRWSWKGVRFMVEMGPRTEVFAPGTTRVSRWRQVWDAAFGADIRRIWVDWWQPKREDQDA